MASQKTQRRPKRPLLAGLAGAVVLALAALSFGLAPANADDTVPDPIVTEEATTTETTDEVVEEDTSTPEETTPAEETPVVPEEEVVLEEDAVQSPSALLVQSGPEVQGAEEDEVDYGIAGTPYPNSSDSNKPGYWEDAGPHDDAICYKHEGEEMWDNDHAYLINDGKTVVLKPYGVDWPGDHYETIIVKAANTDLVTIHPVAGLPGYSAVDNKEISHYIVCKGTTPPPPPPTVEQCTDPNAPITLTTLEGMYFEDRLNPDDPTNKGTHELVDGGIEIAATGGGFYSKSAGYIPVDIPFEEIGSPSLGYTVYSGSSAGLNLVIFKNGVWFGTLVYEPLFAEWWINKVVPGMSAGPNPGYQLAYGTPDEFLQAFVAAGWDVDVKAIGYSLGSGAVGHGLVTSLTIGCDTYLFDAPPPTPPTGNAQNLCVEVEGGFAAEFSASGEDGSIPVNHYTLVDGVLVDTDEGSPSPTYGFSELVSVLTGKGEGDTYTGEVRAGATLESSIVVFAETTFTIDCEEDPEPTIVEPESPTKVDKCGTKDDGVILPGAELGDTESVTDDGTYTLVKNEDGSQTVTFVPNEGVEVADKDGTDYEVVEGNAVWTFTFTDEACPTPPPTTPPGLAATGANDPMPIFGVGFGLAALGVLAAFVAYWSSRKPGLVQPTD